MRGVMIGLARHDDRGAMAPLLAVLLAGGVLFGAAAVVIDVGRVYAEREELQTGADAAAMSMAVNCATVTVCDADTVTDAEASGALAAQGSASDGKAYVTLLCGRAGGNDLKDDCVDAPENAAGCVGPRPAGNYAEVLTTTRTKDDGTLLPYSFAQAVAGGEGVTVGACARVGWGAARRVPLAGSMMISLCSWKKLAGEQGQLLGPKPANPFRPTGAYRDVALQADIEGCDGNGSNVAALAGATFDGCGRAVSVGTDIEGFEPGILAWVSDLAVNVPCKIGELFGWVRDLFSNIVPGLRTPRVSYLPVYVRSAKPVGTRRVWILFIPIDIDIYSYRIVGLAPFVPSGGHGLIFNRPSVDTPGLFCQGNPCLTGYLVKDTVNGPYSDPADTPPGTPANGFGLNALQLAG